MVCPCQYITSASFFSPCDLMLDRLTNENKYTKSVKRAGYHDAGSINMKQQFLFLTA